MKRIANYLLTATALLGAAALLTFAAKNDFGLARNMETLVNMMRELSVYYVDEVDADRLMTDAAESEWCGGSTPIRSTCPKRR